ncbi:MAG TPA: salicylate 1-monooxygenase [Candidatus Pelagibacter sp.]|jgi:salicylate hydroxylase|nr:salicylate 1-monooxygenase [Candidatus Pelagibacter sp.]
MKKKIAIIGSGIAGLTFAGLLKKNSNFEFIIYEKENNLNLDEGFGIQLSINSISILNKIGFSQLNKNEKYNPSKLDFYSIDFNKICDLDLTFFNSTNEKYTTLKRSTLVNFLKENLLSDSIIFSKKVNKVVEVNEKINIYFTDGSSDKVDYLVVSDGVFSNTKSVIENKIFQPEYYGAIAIRSQIRMQDISIFNSDNISLIMGSGAHLILYPVNRSKEFNLVCIIRKKMKSKEDIKTILKNTIFKENKDLENFFKGNLKSWLIYTSNKPIKSIYKNIFYIGDAFYTFPPTMAQGASQAIESANEIFDLIKSNHSDIENKYFKNRKEKTNLINKRSKFNYFGFHISNKILKILRDKILKILVKNKKFINSYLGKIYK